MLSNRHYIDERTFVEDPLLQQLEGLAWQVLRLKSPSDGVHYTFGPHLWNQLHTSAM